jgi:SAM-dependent methyltransferase
LAQNIYDQPAFFDGYSQIPRSRLGLAGAPEWPDLKAMLPDVRGLRILDLGCGFGAFDRWAIEQGAASVLGIDLSENMLATARERGGDMPIRYEQADLETYEPEACAFDLVYSTLVVHYLEDFDAFCRKVRSALGNDGHFVFTTEHPIFAVRVEPEDMIAADGEPAYAIRDYNIEGPRTTDWIAKGVVKYHRKISTMITIMHRHGLMLEAMDEWGPKPDLLKARPEMAEYLMRPQLLLMAARVAADRT